MRQCFTAEDLSCLLLANLHRTALLHVGTDAHIKAVLTVPASFGSAQREAVMVSRPRMRMPPGLAIPAEGCRNREGCLWQSQRQHAASAFTACHQQYAAGAAGIEVLRVMTDTSASALAYATQIGAPGLHTNRHLVEEWC